ncbi:MAG: hypothetical protein ACYDD2_15590 [Candidatus Acidiferrales bacterium]
MAKTDRLKPVPQQSRDRAGVNAAFTKAKTPAGRPSRVLRASRRYGTGVSMWPDSLLLNADAEEGRAWGMMQVN